jgi:hypothetical protein
LYLSGNTSEFRFLANLPRFPSWRSSIVVFLMSDSARNLDRSPRPDSAQSPAASRPTELACLAAVIAVYLGLSFSSAGQMSVTVDEFGHLPSGLYTLISGDPRYAALNPPLANGLSALPVALLDLDRDVAPPAVSDDVFSFWSAGTQFLERHRGDYVRVFAAARAVPILIVAALGGLLFFWARRLCPEAPGAAGVLAAALVVGSPNVIAHARLVGTDTATAAFVALAIFTFRVMLLQRSTRSALLFGACLGAAQLTKFYALLLYPVLFASVFAWHAMSETDRESRTQSLRSFAIAVCVSFLVLNAGYLFSEVGRSLDDLTLMSSTLLSLADGPMGSLPLPVPGGFVRAMDGQLVEVSSGLRSFLLGKTFQGGRWDFYLVLLALKTPLALIVTFALGLAAMFRRARVHSRESMLLLGYPVLLFTILSLGDNRQLGARALLSAVPLVQLWVACQFVKFWSVRWRERAAALAVFALFATSIFVYPNYLAYFNAFVGGPYEGYRYASDANVDIGQDLPALARYLDEVDAGTVQLFYFGSVDPELYGIDYVVPSTYQLKPGYLAVSVSLYRMDYPLYDHGTLRRLGPIDVSALGEPIAKLGGSIHVYRVPEVVEGVR